MSDVLDKPTGAVEAYKLPSGESEINDILMRLDGIDPDEETPQQYATTEAEMPVTSAPEGDPETEPKPGEKPEPDPEPKPAAETVSPEALMNASTLLAKMKLPPSVLKDMTDAQKIDWAKELEPMQSETANAYRELNELRQHAETASPPDPTAQRPEASAAPGEPAVNPKVNLAEKAKAFGESFGEDAVPALLEPLEAMQLWTEGELNSMRAENATLREALLGSLVSGARRELSGEFPGLSDPVKFETVQKLAGALAQTGEYPDPLEALRKAAQVTFAGDIAEKTAQERTSTLSQRSIGQPEVPQPSEHSTTGAAKPMTPEDRDAYALDLIDKGTPKEAVIAAMAKLA